MSTSLTNIHFKVLKNNYIFEGIMKRVIWWWCTLTTNKKNCRPKVGFFLAPANSTHCDTNIPWNEDLKKNHMKNCASCPVPSCLVPYLEFSILLIFDSLYCVGGHLITTMYFKFKSECLYRINGLEWNGALRAHFFQEVFEIFPEHLFGKFFV